MFARSLAPADLPRMFAAWRSLHAGDPAWVTPPQLWLAQGLRAALTQPDRFRLFGVERRGRLVATVSVQRDGRFDDDGIAWLGHVEAADGYAAAVALAAATDAARAWQARHLRGPRGLSRF